MTINEATPSDINEAVAALAANEAIGLYVTLTMMAAATSESAASQSGVLNCLAKLVEDHVDTLGMRYQFEQIVQSLPDQ